MRSKKILLLIISIAILAAGCSLQEFNPSGVTVDKMAQQKSGFIKLLNSCYFDLPRYFYGRDLLLLTEGGTDLWTSASNSNDDQDYLKYSSGGSMPLDLAKDIWNGSYDAINYCNLIIGRADKVQGFDSEKDKKQRVAEAHFLRALYYFHLVEQFGPCPLRLKETKEANTKSTRSPALEIYEKAILPDLRIAVEDLPVTPIEEGRPSKKAALGLLAKACLQTKEYDTDDYLEEALSTAKELINNQSSYGVRLYDDFMDNFNAANNKDNKEALYQITFSQNYGSTNVYDHNMDFKRFYCTPTAFGAVKISDAIRLTVGGWSGGVFMPSKYLLDVFKYSDGTLDPRYKMSFQTSWLTNDGSYQWTSDERTQYDRSNEVSEGTELSEGDLAIKFSRPGEDDYATMEQEKLSQKYLWVDYNDVYSSDEKVKMKYTRKNRDAGKKVDNPFLKFYPSLKKFNSGSLVMPKANHYTSDANATVMRLGEVYLIAAEASYYLKGSNQKAADFINKLRERVDGEQITAGDVNLQFLLDERARELCGEYTRWYDLKRMGKLTHAYLMKKNPDVGQYFINDVHNRRPIPQEQMDAISNPEGYQNNGY